MLKRFMLLPVVIAFVAAGAFAVAQQTSAHSHPRGAKAAEQSQAEAKAKAEADAKAKTEAKVKQIYTIDCAMCHAENGNGKTDVATSMKLTMDDWTDPKTLTGKTDQQLFDWIRKGNDKMPPEDKSRATDDEVKGLITYIRSLAKAQPAAPAAPAAAPATGSTAGTTPPPSN